MTGDPATQPIEENRRPSRRSVLSDPAVGAIALYTVIAIAAAVAAYLTVFTVWAPYDDEGTLLVTLQAFAQGDVLYRDVYSPYGPFYFELFGGLFALTGAAVTNDASRTIVVVLWVGTSFLVGLASHRLTGRLLLGASAMLVAFASLYVLANEPMHPQGLSVLLLGAFVLLAVSGPTRRPLWAGATGGALLAALFLTKVNLGVYAVAAVALASVLSVEPLRRRRWLCRLVAAAAIALPAFVAARDLGIGWVREMVAVQALATAAIVVAAWPLGSRAGGDGDDRIRRWLLGALAGFAVAFLAIVVAIVLDGSSPADVYEGMVTEAMRVRDVVLSEFSMSPSVVGWAVLAVAGATMSVVLRAGEGRAPTVWPGLLRAAAGLAIWLSVAKVDLVAIGPSPGNPVSLALVLAWVAAIPPAGTAEAPFRRFLRVLLPALAVTEALQVYPVAGSQVGIASLAFVPVGALCLGDALGSLREWSATREGWDGERFGAVTAIALVALTANFAIDPMLRSIGNNLPIYRDRQPLPFDGAGQLRPPETEVEDYTRLVGLLHRHRCTDFVGYPNVNSLYLWSGIDPPPPYAPGAWIEALDEKRQQRAVDELRASPRPCAIRNDGLAGLWLGGDPVPARPLVDYVLNEFRTVERVGEFQFMLPLEGGARQRDPG